MIERFRDHCAQCALSAIVCKIAFGAYCWWRQLLAFRHTHTHTHTYTLPHTFIYILHNMHNTQTLISYRGWFIALLHCNFPGSSVMPALCRSMGIILAVYMVINVRLHFASSSSSISKGNWFSLTLQWLPAASTAMAGGGVYHPPFSLPL